MAGVDRADRQAVTLACATRMSRSRSGARLFRVLLFLIFSAVYVIFRRGRIELPSVLVTASSLFSNLQLLCVCVSKAHRLSHLIHVVLARSGRATSNGLISSRFSILPSCIDIAA